MVTNNKTAPTKSSAPAAATSKPASITSNVIAKTVPAKPAVTIKKPTVAPLPKKTVSPTAVKPEAKVTAKITKEKKVKVKMERDSFTMPKDEYAQLNLLKARLLTAGHPVKKSELLRAGIKLLAAMTNTDLKATMEKIPVIKTGRPKK